MSIQVIIRSATWALLVVFFPPLPSPPLVFYTRARSALPRLTGKSSQRDFEIAHLKQAIQATSAPLYSTEASWQAPQAFCVETACAMYNQRIGVYDEPVLNKTTGAYEMASLDHFTQDRLVFAQEVFGQLIRTVAVGVVTTASSLRGKRSMDSVRRSSIVRRILDCTLSRDSTCPFQRH
ncbi:unnamed protein product [Aphanomyces euteiches]|uniref:Uncharacterized protein n=1 Tax=Aphanomyces euteiches TaxID=100861 RepID=A0A6G0WWU2_9STRA|nr:hypothetical protein Ae201684_010899 [Aphanomyces euteiches]KAH9061677.1 hypothetical protein Ae201684P_021012 [Aphanomyces euteiches]